MGRASLFLCGGFAIILGIIQLNIQNSQTGQTMLNVEYVNQSQARNMAMSGMEVGIRRFMDSNEDRWEPETNPRPVTINDNLIQVYIDDDNNHHVHIEEHQPHLEELNPGEFRVCAHSDLGGRSGIAHAKLLKDNIFPEVPGAMGFYGNSSSLNVKGNAVQIDGRDYAMDAENHNEDSDEHLPGIVGVRSEENTVEKNANSGDEYIIGEPENYVHDPNLDGADLDNQIVNDYLPNSEVTNGSQMGSKEYPKIMTLGDTGATVRGDDQGAGILIIPPGSTFEATGDFKFYGLIIVQGDLVIKGRVRIYGSVLFTEDSTLEVDDVDDSDADFRGNSHVLYSSEAMNTIQSRLSIEGYAPQVVSIHD